jgi:hypothetical protein
MFDHGQTLSGVRVIAEGRRKLPQIFAWTSSVEMKKVGRATLLFASLCCAQEPGSYQLAATSVYGSTYSRLEAPFINACPTIHSIGGSQK